MHKNNLQSISRFTTLLNFGPKHFIHYFTRTNFGIVAYKTFKSIGLDI